MKFAKTVKKTIRFLNRNTCCIYNYSGTVIIITVRIPTVFIITNKYSKEIIKTNNSNKLQHERRAVIINSNRLQMTISPELYLEIE